MAFRIIQPNYISGGGGGSTLTDGLVAFWPLTADGTDSVASYDLSAAGTPSYGTVGGQSCVTVSETDRLYYTGAGVFNTASFTIAQWIYSTSTTAGQLIAGNVSGTSASQTRWGLRKNSTQIQLLLSDDAAFSLNLTTSAISTNTWYLLIASYDAGTGAQGVYIDDGTVNNTGTNVTGMGTNDWGIGMNCDADGNASGPEFVGSTKFVGYWNRALTASERSELWNSGTPLNPTI